MVAIADRRVHTPEELMLSICDAVSRSGDLLLGYSLNGAAQLVLYPDRTAWLKGRAESIGASDAPTIEGLTDAWRTAKDLYDIKTGTKVAEDVSDNELVAMGNAEEHLVRELFALENPQYEVYDGTNLLWISKEHPWMTCTLDAVAIHRERTEEVVDVEIKCAPWSAKWKEDFIPDNYFVQLLWQSLVTGIRRTHLKARLRFEREGEMTGATEKLYSIDTLSDDVAPQRDALLNDGKKFWDMVVKGTYFPSLRI